MNTKGINLIAAVQRVCKTLKKKKEQLVAHIPTTISIDLCQGFQDCILLFQRSIGFSNMFNSGLAVEKFNLV